MYAKQQIFEGRAQRPVVFSEMSAKQSFVPYHWHRACEIILITAGELRVTVRQEEYQLYAGDGIIINSGEIHSTVSVSGNSSLLMIIPDEFWETYAPGEGLPVFPEFSRCGRSAKEYEKGARIVGSFGEYNDGGLPLAGAVPPLSDGLHRLMAAKKQVAAGNLLAYYSELFAFMDWLYKCRSREAGIGRLPMNRKQEERLRQIEAYVREHYRQPVSLEEIAKTVYLQPNYFCRFFKRATGMSFQDYLNEYRFLKVYEDITTTQDTIKDILARHGFYNYQMFRRLFYEKCRCTPGQLRASLRAQASGTFPESSPWPL